MVSDLDEERAGCGYEVAELIAESDRRWPHEDIAVECVGWLYRHLVVVYALWFRV
jgi:hypothetical protein